MPKKINAYECIFCSYTDLSIKTVENHEHDCFYNPKNMQCQTCKFFELNLNGCIPLYDKFIEKNCWKKNEPQQN